MKVNRVVIKEILSTDCKSEILWSFVLSLLIPIWIGLAPDFYKWYNNPESGLWLKGLYNLIDGKWLVNIPICLVFAIIELVLCRKIWHDHIIHFYRPILVILGLVILYCKSTVEYAHVFKSLDYRLFFTILLVFVFAIMLGKGIVVLWHSIKEHDSPHKIEQVGFSNDCPLLENFPSSTEKYASTIAERLLSSNLKSHSCALGITGQWGMGKTTFLNALKKKMKERADVVEFNPWICNSPEQVTKNFFASLRYQLSLKHSVLPQPIKEYAKHLAAEVSLSYSGFSLRVPFKIKRKSLFEQKNELSDNFAKLPRPVIVFIDDIDRLESAEIFEVLRLIRNTADLRNVGYIVAYDKEYLTSVLEEKNIKDASSYLEKIFPVEVHLPKVADYQVWETLNYEIENQTGYDDWARQMLGGLESDDKELILKILYNYRRAKRFANLYMLNRNYLRTQFENELDLLECFWLELLQIYDKKTYDILANNPECLLYNKDGRIKIRIGILPSDIIGKVDEQNFEYEKPPKYEGIAFWKEETPKILDKIFRDDISVSQQSIRLIENYDKYFTISVSTFRLSISEMQHFLSEGNEPDKVVERWINEGKYTSSIAFQFEHIEVNRLSKDQLNTYLRGILCFNMKVVRYHNNYTSTLKNILKKEHYKQSISESAHNIVKEWFTERIREGESLPDLCRLLNQAYEPQRNNETGIGTTEIVLVISNEEIENLLKTTIETYLKINPELTAVDLIKENSPLHDMFKNCCVMVKEARIFNDPCEYKQVAFEEVIAFFSQKKTKTSLKEFEDSFRNMFTESKNEDDYWGTFFQNDNDNSIQNHFGSSYKIKLDEFKDKCLVKEQE